MSLETYLQDLSLLIPCELIEGACESSDLAELSIFRELVVYHWERIAPEPSKVRCFHGILRYYLACIVADLRVFDVSDHSHSRFEALQELTRLYLHWVDRRETCAVFIAMLVDELTTLYHKSDFIVKNAIITGFLEHVVRLKQAEEDFSHWQRDPSLRDGFLEALEYLQ